MYPNYMMLSPTLGAITNESKFIVLPFQYIYRGRWWLILVNFYPSLPFGVRGLVSGPGSSPLIKEQENICGFIVISFGE
jgi:hypothetical protein